jgi:hypothetical protein
MAMPSGVCQLAFERCGAGAGRGPADLGEIRDHGQRLDRLVDAQRRHGLAEHGAVGRHRAAFGGERRHRALGLLRIERGADDRRSPER